MRPTHHFPRLADGLILVDVWIFGGLLLLNLVHHGIDSKTKAGHAGQVTNGDFKLHCVVFPRVL